MSDPQSANDDVLSGEPADARAAPHGVRLPGPLACGAALGGATDGCLPQVETGGDLTRVRQAVETVTKAVRATLTRCGAETAAGADDLLADAGYEKHQRPLLTALWRTLGRTSDR